MKITIPPQEHKTHKAVGWYVKHISPPGIEACIQSMGGDDVNLIIGSPVYNIEGTISVTPCSFPKPVSVCGCEAKVYTAYVLEGPTEDVLVEFIARAKAEYEKKCHTYELNGETLHILTWDGGYWRDEFKTPKRSKRSIYVPEIDDILADLKKFYDNHQVYTRLEIPYARTYMFHGLPGTGKTSTIYTLASELNKNIAIIDFSDSDITDAIIRKAVYRLPKDTILCLEDMDSLFSENRKSDKSTITFSGILNILDGVIKNTGLVIVMTTNNLKSVDDTAMKRRVDYYLKFDYMKRDQIISMFQWFFPGQEYEKFLTLKVKLTPCILQKFFIKNIESTDISQHIDDLVYMCEHEYKLSNINSLYT